MRPSQHVSPHVSIDDITKFMVTHDSNCPITTSDGRLGPLRREDVASATLRYSAGVTDGSCNLNWLKSQAPAGSPGLPGAASAESIAPQRQRSGQGNRITNTGCPSGRLRVNFTARG